MSTETIKLAKSINPTLATHFSNGEFTEDEVLAVDMIKSGFNKDFIERTCGLACVHYGRVVRRCKDLGISLVQYCEEAEESL